MAVVNIEFATAFLFKKYQLYTNEIILSKSNPRTSVTPASSPDTAGGDGDPPDFPHCIHSSEDANRWTKVHRGMTCFIFPTYANEQ